MNNHLNCQSSNLTSQSGKNGQLKFTDNSTIQLHFLFVKQPVAQASYNLGHKGWKIYTFCSSPPLCNVDKHFHLTQVCILPFSNIERGNGGVDTYSVDITIIISCFWHFPTQFVQGCNYTNSYYTVYV